MLEIGVYGFVFYRDGDWIYTIIDDKLCLKSPCWDSPSTQRDLLEQIDSEDSEKVYKRTYQTGSKALFFSQCKDQNETWVPLLEKAYAKAHGDYASLEGGWIGEGIEDLSGGVTTELLSSDILDLDAFWTNELSQVNGQFLFGCSTGLLGHGYGERDGICEAHAYVVIDARRLRSGQRLVKLRNPWGESRKGLWEGPWSDGSKEWTAEAQQELKHTFGSDSVFWISYEDLVRKYTLLERTRLFRDPDWQCFQEWAIMTVPWKADYVAKFHVTLTRDSPVVIVLAQPDRRYFEGLYGQYSFRLHFRLLFRDNPDTGDYIIRSHGNYFMKRSISVDVPKLCAGQYTIYIKVTGQRDGNLPSIEDVVKARCAKRENDEKLAQVGHAYDVAHSKVWKCMSQISSCQRPVPAEQFEIGGVEKKEREDSAIGKKLNKDGGAKTQPAPMSPNTKRMAGRPRYASQAKADQLQDPGAPKENHTMACYELEPISEAKISRQQLVGDMIKKIALDSGGGDMADKEEKNLSPWNASCPVNLRIYSKDLALELCPIPSYKVKT